ncbi:MAG: hypothetical protein HFJ60_06540 [Clostridia bacterium]|jgi:hypothetical protein|nr:hypothetical protein [Clostridia bacterium]
MFIKNQKGIAAIDIAISIIVITIFIALIGNLIVNINLNAKDSERKTIATSYAVQEIENIKAKDFQEYTDKGIQEPYVIEEDIMKDNNFTGYHKKITIKDYVLIKQDNSKEPNIVKEATVEISYKIGKEEKIIRLATYISK